MSTKYNVSNDELGAEFDNELSDLDKALRSEFERLAKPDEGGEIQPKLVKGIGQFVRELLLKSTKTNAEILALVHKYYEGSSTTMGCIAWYKSDLRKKGLLACATRPKTRSIEISADEMRQLCNE
jgi:hypothetical protein